MHTQDQLVVLADQIKTFLPVISDSIHAVTIFFLAYRVANPNSWKMSGRKIDQELRTCQKEWEISFQDKNAEELSLASARWLKQIYEKKASLFRIHRRVTSALYGWHFLKWPIILIDFIPSVQQMLDVQVKGQRYVSFLFPRFSLTKSIEGRPVMSFFIHDLMHADHFCFDSSHYQGQVDFYQKIARINLLLQDNSIHHEASPEQWNADWEYLMCDMNGHPEYLLKCMKNLLKQRLGDVDGFEKMFQLCYTPNTFTTKD
jgi:hypothetical protein